MSLILSSVIFPGIEKIDSKYTFQILKEIKHYLTLQTNIILSDNQFLFKIKSVRKLSQTEKNSVNQFYIPKNLAYFYSQSQKIYIQDEEDFQFFDTCYECLLIIKEYLPNKIQIQIDVMEDLIVNKNNSQQSNSQFSLCEFVENIRQQKTEEFFRRVNSNFKTLISQKTLGSFQIENLIYLAQNYYSYKNKISALRFLAGNQNISKQQFAQISSHSVQFLLQLAIDEDFKSFCNEILEKNMIGKQLINIKQYDQNSQSNIQSPTKINQKQFRSSMALKFEINSRTNIRNSQTNIKDSNWKKPAKSTFKQNENKENVSLNIKQKTKNISVKSLLFQLRESTSLKRLSMLIGLTAEMKINDQKYQNKIQKQIKKICTNFLKNQYQNRYSRYSNNQKQTAIKNGNQIDSTEQNYSELQQLYKSLWAYFNKQNKQTSKISKFQKFTQPRNYSELIEKISESIERHYYKQ